jgi:hypothetical protein
VATANVEAANPISGTSRRDETPKKNWTFLMNAAHRYKIVMIGKIIFSEKTRVLRLAAPITALGISE